MHDAVDHLPLAAYWLAPELRELDPPVESTADCSACPMVTPAPGRPTFIEGVRCCTYHPFLTNWQLGRVLIDGDIGARRVLKRIQKRAGVLPLGIAPSKAYANRYRTTEGKFGQVAALRCPYWVPGPLSCGVWKHRNGVCRTWFCHHEQGVHGHRFWVAVRALLVQLERDLAQWLVDTGDPPRTGAATRAWTRWYRTCATRLDMASVEDLAHLHRSDKIAALRARVEVTHTALQAELADLLTPSVTSVEPVDDHSVWLEGYTPYNRLRVPRGVFELLSRLDGETPWKDALEAAEDAVGPIGGADLVEALAHRGVLSPPDDGSRDLEVRDGMLLPVESD